MLEDDEMAEEQKKGKIELKDGQLYKDGQPYRKNIREMAKDENNWYVVASRKPNGLPDSLFIGAKDDLKKAKMVSLGHQYSRGLNEKHEIRISGMYINYRKPDQNGEGVLYLPAGKKPREKPKDTYGNQTKQLNWVVQKVPRKKAE